MKKVKAQPQRQGGNNMLISTNDGYGKTDHAQWASPLLARHRFAAVACARCLGYNYDPSK